MIKSCCYIRAVDNANFLRFQGNRARGKLPPDPKANPRPNPNPSPNMEGGAIFLWENCPDTFC